MSLLLALTGSGPSSRTIALAATEAPDVAAFALTRGHPLTIGATEAVDVAAFALTVTGGAASLDLSMAASEAQDVASFLMDGGARQVSGSGGFNYPQPSSTAEWLGKIPAKAARQIERVARNVRRGKYDEVEARSQLLRRLELENLAHRQAYDEALASLIRYEIERVAQLAENEQFLLAQIEMRRRRNDNAARLLLLMTLH